MKTTTEKMSCDICGNTIREVVTENYVNSGNEGEREIYTAIYFPGCRTKDPYAPVPEFHICKSCTTPEIIYRVTQEIFRIHENNSKESKRK